MAICPDFPTSLLAAGCALGLVAVPMSTAARAQVAGATAAQPPPSTKSPARAGSALAGLPSRPGHGSVDLHVRHLRAATRAADLPVLRGLRRPRLRVRAQGSGDALGMSTTAAVTTPGRCCSSSAMGWPTTSRSSSKPPRSRHRSTPRLTTPPVSQTASRSRGSATSRRSPVAMRTEEARRRELFSSASVVFPATRTSP